MGYYYSGLQWLVCLWCFCWQKNHTDPTVFAVVNGKLYLNLDKNIHKTWNKDRSGNIVIANKYWIEIKDEAAASL